MIVVLGATGNTGKPLSFALLEAGKQVRVVGRDAAKAKELTDRGAQLVIGDSGDPSTLRSAFRGATAVYAMIPFSWNPPDYLAFQRRHVDALASALPDSGVTHVVSLSSVGADLPAGAGVVAGLHAMEHALDAIPGLNTLHLRPTYFMENTFGLLGMIRASGIMGSPIRPDLRMNMIATRDIAAYAAKRLLALDFRGHNVQYLLGQRDLTYNEVASVYGAALGKPDLRYVHFSPADFKQGFLAMGASESLADRMNEFIGALNEGKVLAAAKRDAESTTPTSIEEFAKTFAHVYAMQS
jgi:uncharacterized protein YbjT (DUF2867 family)